MAPTIIEKKNELHIIYLDDEKGDLDNFQVNVNNYNNNLEKPNTLRLRITTTVDFEKAINLLEENEKCEVFICDHNMPNQKGLELIIKYLMPAYPNITYVLYTGAGNLSPDVKKNCKNKNILFFEKSEEFSTLIVRIVSKINKSTGSIESFYYHICEDVVKDLHNLGKQDPKFLIQIADITYSPSEIISEINNQTPIGIEYLKSYVDGLKFFNQ